MTATRTFESTITAADVKPGMIVDLHEAVIGDFDPPMTVRVIVLNVETHGTDVQLEGVAMNTFDHEPYEVDGFMYDPGQMVGTADGVWDLEAAMPVDYVMGGKVTTR